MYRSHEMGKTITTIKIDEAIRDYAKAAAKKTGFTFAAYYEDLILHDLKNNHPEMYQSYLDMKPPMAGKSINTKSILARIEDPNITVTDIQGNVLGTPKKAVRGMDQVSTVIMENKDKEDF